MTGLDGYGDPIPPGHGEPTPGERYADIEVTVDGELMVAHIESRNETATEFIDAYMPEGAEIVVVDSGRIIIKQDDLPWFAMDAERCGFKVER